MIDAIVYTQRRFRLYSMIYKKINLETKELYGYIYNLMCHINENYKNSIISQQVYTKNITKLEDIFIKFKALPQKLSMSYKYLTLKQIRDIINFIV